MDKICIGIPAYGAQPPGWWGPLVKEAYNLSDFDIELESLLIQTTMSTDMNRNAIVNVFLDEKEADWLFWMDADNPLVRGGIRRLLDTKKKLVTGLYITKQGSPKPIAYTRTEEGRYANLPNWKRGELIPIDGAGLGCCLTHRSVYEDIRKNYVPLQRMAGGIAAIHKDDIIGDAFVSTISPEDNKVVDGIRKERMYEAKPDSKVPFFQLGLGRTEDFGFFEKAERLGYQLWLDTSIEVAHLSTKPSDPKEYFEWMDKQ